MKNELIYLVEDEKFFSSVAKQMLKSMGYDNIVQYYTGEDCKKNLYKNPDMIILDHMLGEDNGLDVLREVKSINPDIEVVFLSGQEDLQVAVNSLKYGAFDYVTKDEECFNKLKQTLLKIEKTKELVSTNLKKKNLAQRLIGKLGIL